jgi:hypothetical protein
MIWVAGTEAGSLWDIRVKHEHIWWNGVDREMELLAEVSKTMGGNIQGIGIP